MGMGGLLWGGKGTLLDDGGEIRLVLDFGLERRILEDL